MKRIALVIVVCVLAAAAGSAGAQGGRAGGRRLSVGGAVRSYAVFRPPALSRSEPVPLVVVLHGGFGTGRQAERSYGWDETAAARGFVVAYPDGVHRSWNAGGACCGPASRNHVDDVAFLDALVAAVSEAENIDARRVYVAGISNGAAMAYRYACEGRAPLAAVGSVAGAMTAACRRARPVSVIEIHGLADRNIPFEGGVGRKGVSGVDWPSVQASLDPFRRAARCGAAETTRSGAVERREARCADGRAVVLVTIAGAGHQWPGAVPERPIARALLRLDPPSPALDATAALWSFFERHPLVGPP